MYFYFIIAFQAFCVYHCFKNNNDRQYIWLIVFLPFIGCLVYLFREVFNKGDINKAQEELTNIIVPTKRIKDLEKKLRFSDTFENKVALGDAYLANDMYQEAVEVYQKAMINTFVNDYYVMGQLICAYYLQEKDTEVIASAKKIQEHKEFKGSKSQFLYGLSLARSGKLEDGFKQLRFLDLRYSNYEERVALGMLYKEHQRTDEAKELFEEILIEAENMQRPSYRANKKWIEKAKELLKSL